jgi:outer membrane protein assembly factor BamB
MRFHLIILLILGIGVALPAIPEDWPQFRGPSGQGLSTSTGLPLRWSESENVAWKVAIEGQGWSSPVVLGKQIWVTSALPTLATPEEAKKKLTSLSAPVPSPKVASSVTLKAICVDRDTGRLLKSITLFKFDELLQINSANSYASPTPVIEPGRLYCDFGTMGTVCLDTASDKILWKRRFPIEHQVGPGSSPILHGKLLVLVRDGCDAQYVIALDKDSGETVWKTDRPPINNPNPPYKKSFSTPLLADTTVGKQMIVLGTQWVVSYDPDNGKPLWQFDTRSSYSNISRPVSGHGMVFVNASFASPGSPQLLAIRMDGRGDVTGTHLAWSMRKQIPKNSSPLLVGEELYMVSGEGVGSCLDATSGEVHWTKRILLGSCSASPVFADGRVYFFGEDGKSTVIGSGKQLQVLAENEIDGRIMASAAIAGRAIFLRTDTHLYKLESQ